MRSKRALTESPTRRTRNNTMNGMQQSNMASHTSGKKSTNNKRNNKKARTSINEADMDTDRSSDSDTRTHKQSNNGTYTLKSFDTFNSQQSPQNTNTEHNLSTIKQHMQNITNTHSSTPPNTSSTYTQITYTEHDCFPAYNVVLEKDQINEIATGQLLKKYGIMHVTEIKKSGKNRVTVKLTNRTEANKLLNHLQLKKIHMIKAFVPKNLIISVGVVKDVPLDLSVDELLDSARVQGDIKINAIERMNIWDKTTKTAKPSTSIKIEFRSPTLPESMVLFYVRKNIDHFIPKPTICRKCLRYGHVAKICRATVTTCANCAEDTHAQKDGCNCNHCLRKCVALCKYCNTNDHNAMQSSCPEQKQQYNIKKTMITKSLNYNEAKNLIQNTNPQTTYASVTNLTQQIDALRTELNNIKLLNQKLLERVSSAEKIFDDINEEAPDSSDSNTDNQTTDQLTTQNDEFTTKNKTTISLQDKIQLKTMCKKIEEHRSKYKAKKTLNAIRQE